MKSLLTITTLIAFYSCTSHSPNTATINLTLPQNPIIISKTFATSFMIDKATSLDISYCQKDSASINTIDNCIIQNSDTLKYLRRSTFLFDSLGQVQELLDYHPEGSLRYSKNDLTKDTAIISGWSINLKQVNSIKIDAQKKMVIDNNDTLRIYDHWTKQRFIFVKATSLDQTNFGRPISEYSIIYEYQ